MLSPIQQTIVDTPGNLVVSASAGTGKTHTMVAKIVEDIKNNTSHRVVAAITFTIKAANEIKDRLTVDTFRHFIGTNNSFAIEEIIKPFMKDVYGEEFNLDMTTDYSMKVRDYGEAIEAIKNDGVLCSYTDNKKNFIFDLAFEIVQKSLACQLYLKAKYFKLYIDEYQDCDISMHRFFMYICDNLEIDTFVVGDEKQSIYIWRGAYPEAFKSIREKPNFKYLFMGDNFRSNQQIQNYSNLLIEETRNLYKPISENDNIILLFSNSSNWASEVCLHLSSDKKSALLRYSRDNARIGAEMLSDAGFPFTYVPIPPIADITTNTAWLYNAIASYVILEKYSVYDLISEIPVEGNESRKMMSQIRGYLHTIDKNIGEKAEFHKAVEGLGTYLGYGTQANHIERLFNTINDGIYHPYFNSDDFQNISITFHSSKGLEFEQVIIFAEDYNLRDMSSFYNHYVAVTRAKSKVIIVKTSSYNSNCFQSNLEKVLMSSGLRLTDVLTVI